MNFNNYYFNEEQIEEGPLNIATKIGRAAGAGIGRGIANKVRGALGRMKNIAFNPQWLKVLRPTNQINYKKAMDIYTSWRNKKTKLGPKQNYSVVDIANGVFGEFSKSGTGNLLTKTGRDTEKQAAYDKLIDILKKYDSAVPTDNINMDAEIPFRITVYQLNNGGKIIFFDLPLGEDGKKRYYAMGLDNKSERAFSLIHGMRFEDFIMKPEDEGKPAETKQPVLKKFEVKKQEYDKIVPKLRLAASNNSLDKLNQLSEANIKTYNLIDMIKKVLKEANKEIYIFKNKKDNKWYDASSPASNMKYGTSEIKTKDPEKEYIAVKTDKPAGSRKTAMKLEKDNEAQKDFEKFIKGNKIEVGLDKGDWWNITNQKPFDPKEFLKIHGEKSLDKVIISNVISKDKQEELKKILKGEEEQKDDKKAEEPKAAEEQPKAEEPKAAEENGALYIDIKDNMESPDAKPSTTKETPNAKVGWIYRLKNNGRIFLYQSKQNDKYYISFNDEGEKVVNAKNLIDKYKLEKEGGTPEETPESAIYFGGNLKEQYFGKANNIINRLLSE